MNHDHHKQTTTNFISHLFWEFRALTKALNLSFVCFINIVLVHRRFILGIIVWYAEDSNSIFIEPTSEILNYNCVITKWYHDSALYLRNDLISPLLWTAVPLKKDRCFNNNTLYRGYPINQHWVHVANLFLWINRKQRLVTDNLRGESLRLYYFTSSYFGVLINDFVIGGLSLAVVFTWPIHRIAKNVYRHTDARRRRAAQWQIFILRWTMAAFTPFW